MPQKTTTFGRRRPPIDGRQGGLDANSRLGSPRGLAPGSAFGQTLGSEVEAFRSTLRSEHVKDTDEFSAWLRARQGRRMLVWAGGAALILLPGLARVFLKAPWWICGACEVAAVLANAWLRRERLRRLKAIAGWDGGVLRE